MSVLTKESRIILAIKAIRTTKKMSIQCAVKTYNVPETSIYYQINRYVVKAKIRNSHHLITLIEEETFI